jgi:hypothetical protein
MKPTLNFLAGFTFAFLLCLMLTVTPHEATAQNTALSEATNDGSIKKRTTIIGAYFNFSTSNTTTVRVKGLTTTSSVIKLGGNVTAGKMISDHWGMLLNLGYESANITTPVVVNGTLYNPINNRSDFIITPSFRRYKNVSEGIFLFIQTSVMMSIGTLTADEFDKNDQLIRYTFNTTGFGAGISPGITYFMNKKLSTEIAIGVIGFSVYNGKDNLGNTTQTNGFQSLFYQNSVSLGFVYYL